MSSAKRFISADVLLAIDGLSERLAKAQALAARTYGEDGESFRDCSDDTQDCYLWALADLIDEARGFLNTLTHELDKLADQQRGSA